MNLCSHQQIELWDLHTSDHGYELNISAKDFLKLKPVIRKTKTKVEITQKYGFPFKIREYLSRYFLLSGFFFCILFLLFMSTFVWKIEIKGNHRYSEEEIKIFLKSMDVGEGTPRKEIRCEEIGARMRENFEEIIWVSVSLDGVDLILEVKENTDRVYEETGTDIPSDVVAEKAGLVTSIVTSKGTPLVKAGDIVEEGQVLVSGTVEIYNDAMEVTGYQYCVAEATIYAQTEMDYQETQEHDYEVLERTGKKRTLLWLETEEMIYRIGSGKQVYSYYQIESEQYRMKLASIVPVPWIFGISRTYECTRIVSVYTEEEIRERLSENFYRFCQDLEKKGVQILENDVKIYPGVECTSARGTLTLKEEIGKISAGAMKEIRDKEEGNI